MGMMTSTPRHASLPPAYTTVIGGVTAIWSGWLRVMQHYASTSTLPRGGGGGGGGAGGGGHAPTSSSKLKRRFVALFPDACISVFSSDRNLSQDSQPKATINLLQASGVCLLNAAASSPRSLGLQNTVLVDDEDATRMAGFKLAVTSHHVVTIFEAFDEMQMGSLVSVLAHHVDAASGTRAHALRARWHAA